MPTVGTFVGRDPTKNVPDNVREFRKCGRGSGLRGTARRQRRDRELPDALLVGRVARGTNLASGPALWDGLFTSSVGRFGLNLDPSHLVWLQIDHERVVRDYARILHVHAKDMEIDRDGLYRNGVLSLRMGWQIPRLQPRRGAVGPVPLAALPGGLRRRVSVEHEDRAFEGSLKLVNADSSSRATRSARTSTDRGVAVPVPGRKTGEPTRR